ncbi:MAG: CBS domain-containing protein [Opitutaceae bacterium]
MSTDVRCVAPEATLVEAAKMMRDLDVGSLPICKQDRLAGMITDRDIAVRAVAESKDPTQTTVADAMSDRLIYGYADQEVKEIADVMEEHQIRRLPLLNRDKRLVGIVALGDIATKADGEVTSEVTKAVSAPA